MTYLVGAAELRVWIDGEWLRVRGTIETLDISSDLALPSGPAAFMQPKRVASTTIRLSGWKKDRAGRPVEL